ncbi:hypothetical protein EBQ34_14605 [Vandammella animalimorsus]|uniref:Uncharacterized protein n=1 Tax=Vandammella animalimorsus TaxID=2029117 RepID=A0A3M6QWI6_9BURK|nr:hypothetical protein EBQ34_14605 [Vandammella animalimorsus]
MQLQRRDTVGDDDAALGRQALGDVGQEFIAVVLVALRQRKAQVARCDEAVVGQRELAAVFFAHLQLGQVDGHGFEQDDGRWHLGLVGGFEHDVVVVGDGGFSDAEFDADGLVAQVNVLADGDAWAHEDAPGFVGMARAAGAPDVAAWRNAVELGAAWPCASTRRKRSASCAAARPRLPMRICSLML